jgi:hypothetical protein
MKTRALAFPPPPLPVSLGIEIPSFPLDGGVVYLHTETSAEGFNVGSFYVNSKVDCNRLWLIYRTVGDCSGLESAMQFCV